MTICVKKNFDNKIIKIFKNNHLSSKSIKIVAVSKTINTETILLAINEGYTCFAENYLQEAKQKWPNILLQHPSLELQFIGNLQSNKIKEIVGLFHTVATLDSKKNALLLQKEIIKQQKKINIFIQVNIGSESQKQGILTTEVFDFYRFCQEISLPIAGLMCILPITNQPAPYFALMQKIATQLGLQELSMGMSYDFQYALPFGATQIRIGQAIFGKRENDVDNNLNK